MFCFYFKLSPEELYTLQVITPTELSDAGPYSCLGYNEAGSAELMYHVKISGKNLNQFQSNPVFFLFHFYDLNLESYLY